MKKFVLSLFALFLILVSGRVYAQNDGVPLVVAQIANPACVAETISEAEANVILAEFGAKAAALTPSQKMTYAAALKTIKRASNSPHLNLTITGIEYQAIADLGTKNGLTMVGSANPNRVRVLSSYLEPTSRIPGEAFAIHEIAHTYAGRSSGVGKYVNYMNETSGSTCPISIYCTHTVNPDTKAIVRHANRSEEFAEVFTAYLFEPQMLKSKCPNAFEYMHTRVFGKPSATQPTACSPVAMDNSYSLGYKATDGRAVRGDPPRGSRPEIVMDDGSGALVALDTWQSELQKIVMMHMQNKRAGVYSKKTKKGTSPSGSVTTPASKKSSGKTEVKP